MTQKPNILLILNDDMGYSDIGSYGGEVNTPNLDRLAQGGLRFTQFYNTARCSPSRASLLTGLHPHQTGIGILSPRTHGHYSAVLTNSSEPLLGQVVFMIPTHLPAAMTMQNMKHVNQDFFIRMRSAMKL
jgi:arylsulfatase A-like enzyme